jgi:hypothetical protein
MKNFHSQVLIIAVIFLAAAFFPASFHTSFPSSELLLGGCTTFYGYDGQVALAGNNEDFINPLMYAWFIPASDGRFGRVYFGFDDFIPQGGLNDQGVFFDAEALPYKAMPETSQRPHFPGGDLSLIDEVLSRSVNVQDVIDITSQWNNPAGEYGQNLFGDRYGDSVIIDGDSILRKQGPFQIATNFRLVDNPSSPWPEGEERYGVVSEMLANADHYTVDLFRQALDVSHAEGLTPTLYSQVYELTTGTIHLYLFHDFEHEVVINLADELAKGPHVVEIRSLFPENRELELWADDQLNNWHARYQGLINSSIEPASLAWMSGDYDVVSEPDSGPVRIFIEEDQLFMLRPNQLPIALYPLSTDSVFHHFLNGFDLTFTFHRDANGQVIGADGSFSYDAYSISIPYDLSQPKDLSATANTWIAVAGFALVLFGLLTFLIRKRTLQ